MDVFARHQARATFFVDRFDILSDADVEMLRDMRAAGHAIGCHSLRHLSAAQYAQEFGMQAYLMRDIEPAIAAMSARGFGIHSFAYPNSRHDDDTDAALLRYFGRLRSGKAVPPDMTMEQCDYYFTPLDKLATTGRILGLSIDSVSNRSAELLRPAFRRAAQRGEVICFYAHRIDEKAPGTSRLNIAWPELEEYLAVFAQEGLATYTYDDLPSCITK